MLHAGCCVGLCGGAIAPWVLVSPVANCGGAFSREGLDYPGVVITITSRACTPCVCVHASAMYPWMSCMLLCLELLCAAWLVLYGEWQQLRCSKIQLPVAMCWNGDHLCLPEISRSDTDRWSPESTVDACVRLMYECVHVCD